MLGSIIGGLLGLIAALLSLLGFIFWLWMLIDAIRNKNLTDTEKIVWVLVIIFLNFLGAVIYLFAGRKHAT